MNPTPCLQRAPLLGPGQQVLGYRLGWQGAAKSGAASLRQLLTLLAQCPQPAGPSRYFIPAEPAALPAELVQRLAPRNIVLMLDQADLAGADGIAQAMTLSSQDFGLALCNPDLAALAPGDGLLALMTHVDIDFSHPGLGELAGFARLAGLAGFPLSVMVNNLADRAQLKACADLGLEGFFPSLCIPPASAPAPPAVLGPQAVLIMQLMQRVQDNADVRELEKVLRRDATLSYQLLRHINSASFGIGVEIESLRHAVAMLGYAPLYRWLSLLLARTSRAGFSPALLQASIIRGRFVELLGLQMLSRAEASNLFVVGLFSLLDQLLGVPLAQMMRQVSLPESMVQALLHRQGVHGPFLALAEACEREDDCAAALADALFLTPAQVNQAHLAALAWSHNLKL